VAEVSFAVADFFAHFTETHPTGHIPFEGLAALAGLIGVNLCYSLGPFFNWYVREPQVGPGLLKAGLFFTTVVLSFPALAWAVVILRHVLGYQ
jgi:hypothetical protein